MYFVEKKRNVTTLQGENVFVHGNLGQIYVDEARFVQQDIMTSNGVIHVIDKVLKSLSSKLAVPFAFLGFYSIIKD